MEFAGGSSFRSGLFFERNSRRIIKRSDGFQSIRVEAFHRAAVETGAIRTLLIGERAAQMFVPATENFAHDSDFFTKHAVGPI